MSSLWECLKLELVQEKFVIVTFVICVCATQKIFYFLLLEIIGVIDAKEKTGANAIIGRLGRRTASTNFRRNWKGKFITTLKHADPR